ncbi:hypothetical protein OKW41_004336 [Paraburkholderia sp. UCT70]|uniref:hypothetical protein n=1 Tax=Paraburkholderia sp. UCT70 TaxID=2991068 RepID=UPI003D1C66AD
MEIDWCHYLWTLFAGFMPVIRGQHKSRPHPLQERTEVARSQKAGAGIAWIEADLRFANARSGEPLAACWMSVPGQHVKRICWLRVDCRTFDTGPVRMPTSKHLNVRMYRAAL